MRNHALNQYVGPQFRGQDERGTLWATACGRTSPHIAMPALGKLPAIPLTCKACIRICPKHYALSVVTQGDEA